MNEKESWRHAAGLAIRKLLTEQNSVARDVAGRSGMTASAFSKMLNAKQDLDAFELLRICHVFSITPNEFFDRTKQILEHPDFESNVEKFLTTKRKLSELRKSLIS
jgi:transcriptional regulator with XRE-family HTH domain